jgi:uncharacterized membrane protein YgaE (UPF0421/DUF939 family)
VRSNQHRDSQIAAVLFNGGMTFALCGLSYWLITHLLARVFSVSRNDDLLGGMWAVVATVFVFRDAREQSARAALSRMAATSLSFVLCFIYLLLFPFHFLGMAALVGIGTVVMSLFGRPDDIITTGITTTVVMVVAAMSPNDAWHQPILRMIDTIIGVVVGLVGAWISLMAVNWVRRTSSAVEIARKTLKEQVCSGLLD